jgi:hypothetical protein
MGVFLPVSIGMLPSTIITARMLANSSLSSIGLLPPSVRASTGLWTTAGIAGRAAEPEAGRGHVPGQRPSHTRGRSPDRGRGPASTRTALLASVRLLASTGL